MNFVLLLQLMLSVVWADGEIYRQLLYMAGVGIIEFEMEPNVMVRIIYF